jgi:hypothetical protein
MIPINKTPAAPSEALATLIRPNNMPPVMAAPINMMDCAGVGSVAGRSNSSMNLNIAVTIFLLPQIYGRVLRGGMILLIKSITPAGIKKERPLKKEALFVQW